MPSSFVICRRVDGYIPDHAMPIRRDTCSHCNAPVWVAADPQVTGTLICVRCAPAVTFGADRILATAGQVRKLADLNDMTVADVRAKLAELDITIEEDPA